MTLVVLTNGVPRRLAPFVHLAPSAPPKRAGVAAPASPPPRPAAPARRAETAKEKAARRAEDRADFDRLLAMLAVPVGRAAPASPTRSLSPLPSSLPSSDSAEFETPQPRPIATARQVIEAGDRRRSGAGSSIAPAQPAAGSLAARIIAAGEARRRPFGG
jgi:hypothetical protein